MRPGRRQAQFRANIFGQTRASFATCSGSICQILTRFKTPRAGMPRNDSMLTACLLLFWARRNGLGSCWKNRFFKFWLNRTGNQLARARKKQAQILKRKGKIHDDDMDKLLSFQYHLAKKILEICKIIIPAFMEILKILMLQEHIQMLKMATRPFGGPHGSLATYPQMPPKWPLCGSPAPWEDSGSPNFPLPNF